VSTVQGSRSKGEADAMQYTLPLKEKQIEQSKLEAEARKEATSRMRKRMPRPRSSTARLSLSAATCWLTPKQAACASWQSQRRAHDQRGRASKQVALADQQDHRRTPFRQDPGCHGSSDGKFFFANDVFKSMAQAL